MRDSDHSNLNGQLFLVRVCCAVLCCALYVLKGPTPRKANGITYLTDTGLGASPEKQEAIFEAFTQADGATTRNLGGTGLGVSIASQLTKLMGGEIGG